MNALDFVIAATLLALSPGPDILYAATTAVSRGIRLAMFLIVGLVLGLYFHGFVVAYGLGSFVNNTVFFDVIRYAGIIYLVYLAFAPWVNQLQENNIPKPVVAEPEERLEPTEPDKKQLFRKAQKFFMQGLLMNAINPKVTFFMIGLLPSFTTGDEEFFVAEVFALTTIMVVVTFFVFTAVACLASRLRLVQSLHKYDHSVRLVQSVVLLLIAAYIAVIILIE